ncbi:HAMP domain-containing histidine kinase [Microlunatus elymi]|uniref:histidine kinase n=1 Tax=Microlunatus elymi TaxID=2596828 RepID=A0A516Q3J1_9ACTN|nr:HAMP domain-containing sensor histidine kinase [Microlunatus elymi]QDP97952.1 HAMP domain-containing histidine kinase [Microlunatus elymi]
MTFHGVHRPQQRLRRPLTRLGRTPISAPIRMAAEAVVVFGATVVGALLLHLVMTADAHPLQGQAVPVLGATTAGSIAVVAVLSALNSHLRPDLGLRLISYAFGFYALVGMPISVVNAVPGRSPLVRGAAAASVVVFGALLLLGLAERLPRWWSWPRAITAALVLNALAMTTAVVLPERILDTTDLYVGGTVLLAGWGLLACAFIMRGLRRRSPAWWRIGFGLALLCAARALLLFTGSNLEFAVMRFIGVLVLLAAACLQTHAVMIERRAVAAEEAERTAAAERAALERRHEIRNALIALSSVTTLMTPRPDVEAVTGGRSISAMINDELARLHGLLEKTSPSDDDNSAAVDAVLTRLVTLRRLSGSEITLRCPPGLRVAVSTATLAQVVTNLLANCARHAPGAEVYVGVERKAAGCVIEISDAGPGLDPAAPTIGDGLGLALSSRLVEAAGGRLELRTGTRFPTGTTALLHLPTAAESTRHLTVAPAVSERMAS